MLNGIPFFGWIISLLVNISMAVPFWFCWTYYGIGTKYFYFLPSVYQVIGFWACIGLFTVLGILKSLLWPGAIVVSK